MNWSQTVQSNQHVQPHPQYQIRQPSRGQPTQPPQPQQTQPPYHSNQQTQPPYRQPYDSGRRYQPIPSSHSSNPQSKPAPQALSSVNKAASDPSSALNTVDGASSVAQESRDTTLSTEELQSPKQQATQDSSDHKVNEERETQQQQNPDSKDADLLDTVNKESEEHSNDEEADPTPKKKPFSSNSVNSKMLFGTRYEVKCDETFAYYEGYVYDYDEDEKKLRVSYPWKADQTVPVNYVRPLAPIVEANWKPKQGDHVECQAKAEESEPYGWWDCIIKTVRDNLYLITYEGWDNHHEVLQHNMLRPYNDQEAFEDDNGIIREFLNISRERINEFKATGDLSSMNMDPAQYNDAQRTVSQLRRIAHQTHLIHMNFSPSTEKLILIGKRQNVYDAKMLIKFVWDLRQLYRKKEEGVKNEFSSKQAEYEELKTCVRIKFSFPIALTKYVIGTKGENILSAKSIEGVKHINVRNMDKDTSECLILATDHNAADEARDILEMQQDFELIPQVVRKELIGKDGGNIKRLEERSQVIKICTLDHLKYIRDSNRNYYNQNKNNYYPPQPSFIDEEEEGDHDPDLVKLIIIGPKEKVPFAKMLIKSEVASIQQKRKFIERQLIAKQEINSIHNNGHTQQQQQQQHQQEWMNEDQHHYNNQQQQQNRGYNGYSAADDRSLRRQRRNQTQQSSKNTSEFNYTQYRDQQEHGNMMNEQPQQNDYPQLQGNEAKDLALHNENEENTNEISWLEHDAAGIAEDEEDERAARQNDTKQRYETQPRRYRTKAPRQNVKAKPRWKPKENQ